MMDRRRTRKLQGVVMVLALLKYFVIASLQTTNSYVFSSSLLNQSEIAAQFEGSFYIF